MKVRAATLADLPTTTDIAIEAFQDDFLYQWMYPQKNQFPADYRAASLLRQKHNLYTPGCCFLVAETEPSDQQWSGHPKISGYAIWDRVGHTAAAAPWQSRSIADRLELLLLKAQLLYEQLLHLDRSIDRACKSHFAAQAHGWFAHLPDCWHVGPIAIARRFQRQGVGRQLLGWGLERAMCDRIPVVLEAAPGARAFYVRSGFREFDTIAWADQVDPVFIFEPEGMEGRCEPRGRGREEQLVGVVAPS